MEKDHSYFVYIMASKRNGTLYTGVTNDIFRRANEHAHGIGGAFTKRYRCKILVWYQSYQSVEEAIHREKMIKKGTRKAKLELIEGTNPQWHDLAVKMRA